MRMYLPIKVIFTEAARRGGYHLRVDKSFCYMTGENRVS